MQRQKNSLLATTALILIVATAMLIVTVPSVNAAPSRKTAGYISVSPKTIGTGQTLLVNLWVYPPPSGPLFTLTPNDKFRGITVTFTRPDGTTDTFMPQEPGGLLQPGESEEMGAIYFNYVPSQVGTWTVKFTFPGTSISTPPNYSPADTVEYLPCTSPPFTFTVQQQPVQIYLPPVPLPTGYWERPISTDNREWSQISGNWLGTLNGNYNPYSKAPNTAHILWKQQATMGGIAGGEWGSTSYDVSTFGVATVIMDGKVYYNMPGGVFRCADLRTGKVLWEKPGTISKGQHLIPPPGGFFVPAEETQYYTLQPYLWEFGPTAWKMYEPLTGTVVLTIPNVPVGVGSTFGMAFSPVVEGSPIFYVIRQSGWNTTKPLRFADSELIKWDLNKAGVNWEDKIVWRVPIAPDQPGPGDGIARAGLYISSDVGVVCAFAGGENRMSAFNLNNGARLWNKTTDYINEGVAEISPIGAIYNWDTVTRTIHAYNMKTGTELWVSDPVGEYPWGVNSGVFFPAIAYGNIYFGSYDGHAYAYDYTTGKLKWKSDYIGDTTETPYNTWPLWNGPIAADGKLYMGTSEHTPTQPKARGQQFLCIDALTGKFLWQISGAINPLAVAEGYVIGLSENDGMRYCFGKGKTATTVSVSMNPIEKGSTTVIQGTVMDQSPAQPNTPCVSSNSMSAWMNYLHMQKVMPTNVTGVPIKLTATKADGTQVNLGTVTSDSDGIFSSPWTPLDSGQYKITASFDGDESYWSSHGSAVLEVGPAPPVSAAALTIDYAVWIYAIVIIAIIAVVIGLVNMLMLQKK